MSDIADQARVTLFLADYAANDALGKVNALGAGWSLTGHDPATGMTGAWAVVVIIDVPPAFYGHDYALSLALRGPDGRPVTAPGPTGEQQTIQVAQSVHVDTPNPPGVYVPGNTLWAHTQLIMNFAAGLPLASGQQYTWTVEIDGTSKPHWRTSFYVVGPRPGPVFGGQAGPASIPEIS